MKKQAGFTLIELVVVILILGILAATALPRFMNVTAQAHHAAVAGTGGAMGSAVALAHAQWVARGNTGAATNVTGFGAGNVDFNASGWPVDTADAAALSTTTHCTNVWNGVMLNPPTIGASGDYTVAVNGTTCTYTYRADTTRNIQYASATGQVTVTNPAVP